MLRKWIKQNSQVLKGKSIIKQIEYNESLIKEKISLNISKCSRTGERYRVFLTCLCSVFTENLDCSGFVAY